MLLAAWSAACVPERADPVPTEEPTPEITPESAWTEIERDGVSLRIRTPDGWQAMSDDNGILLAENAGLENAGSPEGVLIYVFVPEMDDIDLNRFSGTNMAWGVLDLITRRRDYVGDSTVSEAVGFRWGQHQAAYYLLSDRRGNHTMVIGVAVPQTRKLVVCNISTPPQDAHRIRRILPSVLASLTVNGVAMDESALDALPDPLPFPRQSRPERTEESVSLSTPSL